MIDHGRVIADDAPSVLKAQLGSTVAELGFEDESIAEQARVLLAGRHPSVEREGSSVKLSSNEGPRLLIDILRELDGASLSPASLAVHEPSLDDVFLALTGHHAEESGAVRAAGRRGAAPSERRGMSLDVTTGVVRERSAPVRAVRDARAVTWRYLIHYRRVPQLLVFSTIQPVIFVLMFRYVFGEAIDPPGSTPYVEFLMPGIFVQTVVFGAIATAIGLATDMKSGLLERFRSLPMARSAVLAGRTIADLSRNVFVVLLMVAVGFAVGFRVHTGLVGLIAGLLLLLFFGYALSWIFATIGLWVGDPETAQAAAFPLIAPLVFASSLFVPIERMPSWMQPWAEHQPVSVTATAVRDLMLGGPDTAYHVAQSLAWCVAILRVFVPLADSPLPPRRLAGATASSRR